MPDRIYRIVFYSFRFYIIMSIYEFEWMHPHFVLSEWAYVCVYAIRVCGLHFIVCRCGVCLHFELWILMRFIYRKTICKPIGNECVCVSAQIQRIETKSKQVSELLEILHDHATRTFPSIRKYGQIIGMVLTHKWQRWRFTLITILVRVRYVHAVDSNRWKETRKKKIHCHNNYKYDDCVSIVVTQAYINMAHICYKYSTWTLNSHRWYRMNVFNRHSGYILRSYTNIPNGVDKRDVSYRIRIFSEHYWHLHSEAVMIGTRQCTHTKPTATFVCIVWPNNRIPTTRTTNYSHWNCFFCCHCKPNEATAKKIWAEIWPEVFFYVSTIFNIHTLDTMYTLTEVWY